VHVQFGSTATILLALVSAYALAGLWMWRQQPRTWRFHASLIAAAVALIVFFFIDDISSQYIAYSRFMLYPLFLTGLLLVPLAARLAARAMVTFGIVVAVMLALQLAPLGRALALDRRPPYARNSAEWVRIPTFYPIRALLEQVARTPNAGAVRSVRLAAPGVDMISAPVAYPDLNRRFAMRQAAMDSNGPTCRCAPGEAVFYGIEYRTGMALEAPADGSIPATTKMCLQEMHVTCARVLQAFHDTGDLVGAVGVPRP
jgi:hypothetical protein